MYDAAAKMIYESVVDIGARVVESWTAIPGRFPSYLVEHMTGVEEVVRADPRWQEAMRKRGVSDFDLAMIENARGEREKAAERLLEIVKADRTWRDDGAKAQLLQFFEAWGMTDEATLAARRNLSSLLFS